MMMMVYKRKEVGRYENFRNGKRGLFCSKQKKSADDAKRKDGPCIDLQINDQTHEQPQCLPSVRVAVFHSIEMDYTLTCDRAKILVVMHILLASITMDQTFLLVVLIKMGLTHGNRIQMKI